MGTPSGAKADIPLVSPTLPRWEDVTAILEQSHAFDSTSPIGNVVRKLENEAQEATGAEEVVAVSSCTSALILTWSALRLPAGGEVISPSFTSGPTAHALVWNKLTPVFVDCLPGTCTVDPEEVAKAISPKTVGICAVNVFGLPPDVKPLEDLAKAKGLPLIFDSAQGLCSTYKGQPAGTFGLAECFSMSSAMVITAVEGGLLATDDGDLAGRLRLLRQCDHETCNSTPATEASIGLSARLSDLHAAIGLLNLRRRDMLVAARRKLVGVYRQRLGGLPGCWIQEYPPDRMTNGNNFVLSIDAGAGCSRDEVMQALAERGIQTRRIFNPPVHSHTGQRKYPMRVVGDLSRTWEASRSALALPLYSDMTEEQQEQVIAAVEALLLQ